MRVGSIGGGGMGSLLIRNLSQNDIPCIVSDISDKALENVGSAQKTKDNKQVAKESDVLFFSLPHDNLESAVWEVAPYVLPGTTISSQQSVKSPEVDILTEYFPYNPIVPIHILAGPTVDPKGTRVTVSDVRGNEDSVSRIEYLLGLLGMNIIRINVIDHDYSMAEIQVGSHAGLEAMGSAWRMTGVEPWKNDTYADPLDRMKRAMTHRIFSNKGELYSVLPC